MIAYYLSHRDEVDEYIRQQEAAAAAVRHEIETKHPEVLALQATARVRLAGKRFSSP